VGLNRSAGAQHSTPCSAWLLPGPVVFGSTRYGPWPRLRWAAQSRPHGHSPYPAAVPVAATPAPPACPWPRSLPRLPGAAAAPSWRQRAYRRRVRVGLEPVKGLLLGSSYDKKICLWDLAPGSGASVLDAQRVFEVLPHRAMLFPLYSFCVIHHHNWSFLCHSYNYNRFVIVPVGWPSYLSSVLIPRELTTNITSVYLCLVYI
jgi:hypothetical protein